MIWPATADPTATPTEIAEVSHASPSVRRPGGACWAIREKPVMNAGEMHRPEQKMTAARTARPGMAQNVAVPAPTRHSAIANLRCAGLAQDLDPKVMPPTALPSA